MQYEIKHRYTAAVLFTAEIPDDTEERWRLRVALRLADEAKVSLRYSDFIGSNHRGSNLIGSNLSYSDLRGSNLRGSNIRGSNIRGSV